MRAAVCGAEHGCWNVVCCNAEPLSQGSQCTAGRCILDMLGLLRAHYAPQELMNNLCQRLAGWVPLSGSVAELLGGGISRVRSLFKPLKLEAQVRRCVSCEVWCVQSRTTVAVSATMLLGRSCPGPSTPPVCSAPTCPACRLPPAGAHPLRCQRLQVPGP